MHSNINRRAWLKTTGAALAGIGLIPALPRPAFGMTPIGDYSLYENYHVMAKEKEPLKARLLANENPWGPSKKAMVAIAESASMGNRYVYGSTEKMITRVIQREKVAADQVLLAAGSTDLLEKTAFALCMKGGNVISADPSYLSLVKTATAIGATWKNIPLRADYAHDLDAMEKAIDADTKLIYVCNPNNPTGTLTPINELKAFIKKVNNRVPIFVDEAYLELLDNYDSQTTVDLLLEGYDVMVCRTFSKIHGMAGLRVGYMVAKPARVKMIQDLVRTEMGMCVTSLEGAVASMDDMDFQDYTRKHNKEGREYTFAELKRAGFDPIPSYTNFILFPIKMPVQQMLDKMMEKGVGIRGYEINGKPYGRVSMGTMDELKLFVKTLNGMVS